MTLTTPLLFVSLLACGDKDGGDSGATDGGGDGLTGTWELTCSYADDTAPYSVGDTETFVVGDDGTLTVGGETFTDPADSGAVRTWTGDTWTWELSDVSTGTFNEFNLYDTASGAFLAQFTDDGDGDGDGGDGTASWTLEATGGSTSGSTARPYEIGETTTLTWDEGQLITTSDGKHGDITPTWVGEVTLEGADATRFDAGYAWTFSFPAEGDGSYSRFDYVLFTSADTLDPTGFAELEVTHVPVGADGSEGLPSSSQMRPQ